ncbi:MAG: hypothetical protein COA61_001905 [Zetaproteobacteria bacterium]|nr:hypothetical protein [Zetaproteobacteria bacterium]
MKKTLLSAAAFATVAVSAVAIAPTTSEAIPAFARQTGAACLSCHFQSFPTLNAFGRAFKKGSFTDMGDQALIEDDELGIPAQLNITAMIRPQFVKTSVAGVTTNAINATADQVLMIAGRVGEHTGAFAEVSFGGGAGTAAAPGGAGGFGNVQLMNSWDMGDLKVGANFYNTGFGEDAGLQLMSVWGQHAGLMGGGALSINGSMAMAQGTAGVSAWVANDTVAVTLGLVDPSAGVGASWKLAPMVRVQSFFDVGDMEIGAGAIVVSGQNQIAAIGTKQDAKRYGVDFQIQGEAADMQYGVYADYASASAGTLATANVYNASTVSSRTGYSLRATIKPTHNMVFLAGMGQDKTGAAKTDKILVGAEYEMYQNGVIALTYGADKAGAVTTKTTKLDFEFLM